jgi:hypothetical protein
VPNRAAADFSQQLKTKLQGVAANLRDYTAGYRSIKVIDPDSVFRGREDDQIWGDDPVHPCKAAYDLLSTAGKDFCEAAANHSCKKRPRAASDAGGTTGPHQRRQFASSSRAGMGGTRGGRSGSSDEDRWTDDDGVSQHRSGGDRTVGSDRGNDGGGGGGSRRGGTGSGAPHGGGGGQARGQGDWRWSRGYSRPRGGGGGYGGEVAVYATVADGEAAATAATN